MPENSSISTFGVATRWAVRAGIRPDQLETTLSLSSQREWHLLFRELVEQPDQISRIPLSATDVPSELTTAPKFTPVIVPRARIVNAHPEGRYILLKKYEGVVISRGQNSFTARLVQGPQDYPALQAEFDLEELSETDRILAVEGAAMVWTIGYHYDGSTRKRESVIYFRRLPPWTDKEISTNNQHLEALISDIRWD